MEVEISKNILLKYHEKYLKQEDYDKEYNFYKPKFDNLLDFNIITAKDFQDIAIKFANVWKSRTKNSINIADLAVSKLKTKITEFLQLKDKNLIDLDLDKYKFHIMGIYDSLVGINPTARGKILHMLNDKVFAIWDASIRKNYGVYGNSQGYFIYIVLVQMQLKKLGKNIISEIENETKRPILKILDEYNWFISNKE